MGCGASSEAKPPAPIGAVGQASGAAAGATEAKAAAAPSSSSGGVFEPEPELVLSEAERHDEIVAGESTVVGGVSAPAAGASEHAAETSQLDGVVDESANVDSLATIADGDGAAAPANQAGASRDGIERGGTWSAQSKFSEKMEFSAAEVDKLAKAFAEKDSDRSGSLDFQEFSAHIGTLGEMSPLLTKRLFAAFDKDRSGTVDQAEFLAGVAACCKGSKEEKMSLAFSVHDVDNDGYLVPEELDAMLRAFVIGSAKLAAQACDVMEIEDLDIDQDVRISSTRCRISRASLLVLIVLTGLFLCVCVFGGAGGDLLEPTVG
eukprot:COSAG02_NODE_138_length_34440_cov_16.694368_11_plen_320_part_00